MFSTQNLLSALLVLSPLVNAVPINTPSQGPARLSFIYCEYETHPWIPGSKACEILSVYTVNRDGKEVKQEVVGTSTSHTDLTCGAMKKYRDHKNDNGFKIDLDRTRKVDLKYKGKETETGTPNFISKDTALLQKLCPKISGHDGGQITDNSFVYEYQGVQDIMG